MRRLFSFVAILILLSTATPLLACMTGKAMSQEESACCRSMHGHCGGMEKMGCCKTELRTDQHPQLVTSAPAISIHWALVDWLAPFFASTKTVSPPLLRVPSEHSPPGLLIGKLTVLRI